MSRASSTDELSGHGDTEAAAERGSVAKSCDHLVSTRHPPVRELRGPGNMLLLMEEQRADFGRSSSGALQIFCLERKAEDVSTYSCSV